MTNKNKLAYILLVLTTLFWSGNFIVGKAASGYEIPPFSLNFYRWLFAGLILLPFTFNEMLKKKSYILIYFGFFIILGFTSINIFNSSFFFRSFSYPSFLKFSFFFKFSSFLNFSFFSTSFSHTESFLFAFLDFTHLTNCFPAFIVYRHNRQSALFNKR